MIRIEATHLESDASLMNPLSRADRLVMTSVRLDRNLHKALRQIAFDRRQSLHSLLIEGARSVCARYQQNEVSTSASD